MMEISMIIYEMDLAKWSMQKAMFMKGNSSKIENTAKVSFAL